MKAFLLSVLWSLMTCGSVLAQDVLVRTAEHDGFTRLVVDLPPGAEYSLDRAGDTLSLAAADTVEFDTDGVYDRIPRQRITEIQSPGSGALKVALGCVCRVESLQNKRGWVIIDIFDDAVAESAPSVRQWTPLPVNTSVPSEPPNVFGPLRLLPGSLARNLEDPSGGNDRRAVVDQARTAITEQFARGADQGLVNAIRTPQIPTSESALSPPKRDAPEAPLIDGDTYPNMRVETQIDRDRIGHTPSIARSRCLPAEQFDFATWGRAEAPLEAIRVQSQDLYDDADQPDPEAHARLARAYIFATFAEEARAILLSSPDATPDRDVLLAITAALQGTAQGTAFAGQISCDSNAAILAVLSTDDSRLSDPAIVLRRLANLPDPLRAYLGPRVAERFLDLGLREAAEIIRNGYVRRNETTTSETSFVEARLAETDPARVDAALEPVLADRMPRAAEAMVFLLTSQIARGEAPPLDLIEQALALSFETSDPGRAELEHAILKSLLESGDINRAFAELDRIRAQARGPFEDIERDLFRMVAAMPDDADFLKTVVPLTGRAIREDQTRLAIAERLASQTLFAQAEQVIDNSGAIPTRDERILRAEIAADSGKADIARSYLAGLEGEDADRVLLRLESPAAPPDAPAQQEAVPIGPASSDMRQAEATLSRSADLRRQLDGLLLE